ncbi:MAG: hypothetical protein ACYC26_02100 [Phycisphaerales bacterium]
MTERKAGAKPGMARLVARRLNNAVDNDGFPPIFRAKYKRNEYSEKPGFFKPGFPWM